MFEVVDVEVGGPMDGEFRRKWANITVRHTPSGEQFGLGGWWIAENGAVLPYEGTENWGDGSPPDPLGELAAAHQPYSSDWWAVVNAELRKIRRGAKPLLESALAQ